MICLGKLIQPFKVKHFKCTEHWVTVDALSLKILGWEQGSIKEDIAEQHD